MPIITTGDSFWKSWVILALKPPLKVSF